MAPEITKVADPEAIAGMLSVGMSCICQIQEDGNGGPPYKAMLRGWHEGTYVIAEVLSADDSRPPLSPNISCVLKFRRDGHTWECETNVVEAWDGEHAQHVRFAWPDNLQRINTRKFERIETTMPCNVVFDEGTWVKGHIRDIGAGGCRLCVKTPPGAGSTVYVSFTLPDGTTLEDVRSAVRTVTPFGRGAFLGCQFDTEAQNVQQEVELFVATQLEQNRLRRDGGKRVLVIEPNPKTAAGVRRALEKRSFDVATAGGLVEGFALLRSLLPSVLMLNVENAALNGPEICRIVRSTPGFRKLPIYMYGPAGPEIEQRALEAGATGYLPHAGGSKLVDSLFVPESSPSDIHNEGAGNGGDS